MADARTLTIDGQEVVFSVKTNHQAMAVPLDFRGSPDPQYPFLSATVMRGGKREWSGMLIDRADPGRPVAEQYSDEELERLYRQARAKSG